MENGSFQAFKLCSLDSIHFMFHCNANMQKIQTKFEFGGFDPKHYWNSSPILQLDMLDQLDKNQGDHIAMARRNQLY